MNAAFDEQTLRIFPLTGQLLLPGTFLPLNIFEERYLNMIEDALEGDGRIGMIQPLIPGLDNWGVPPSDLRDPELYPIGCCGRIDQHELQEDGRYLIVLKGIVRFRVVDELEPVRGYRRIRADLSEFASDQQPTESAVDKRDILAVLDRFARQKDLEFDQDVLMALSADRLVSTLSVALPFSSVEKQALLEAGPGEDRASLLMTLMGIDLDTTSPEPANTPPTIH